jgi:amidohydrolase
METTIPFPAAALAATLVVLAAVAAAPARAQDAAALHQEIDSRTGDVLPRVVALRRDFHAHPELGNRELRTAEKVAERLRELGYEVKTGVAHTGVVAFLRGARPTPVVALRSDMDALPVTEEVDLPFRSTVRAEWNGREVGVMHACGHDNHMAILLGAAEVLAGMRERLPGSVKLLFQPAEEGAPRGEEGGAALMVKQGVLEDPKVDAVFGLHVFPFRVGTLAFRPNGIMAAADGLRIKVRGSQTHGALPWRGVDPIVVSSQIVLGLQTILSRQVDLTTAPAIVTIGSFQAGNRGNIIPDEVVMEGTIRTFDPDMQKSIWERVRRTVASIAESAGAAAEVEIEPYAPVTFNDPKLTEAMEPTLRRVGGERVVPNVQVTTTAEDFAFYQERVPGLFFFLGVTPENQDPATAAPNHSPRFFADEAALPVGVRALANLAVDYMLQAR